MTFIYFTNQVRRKRESVLVYTMVYFRLWLLVTAWMMVSNIVFTISLPNRRNASARYYNPVSDEIVFEDYNCRGSSCNQHSNDPFDDSDSITFPDAMFEHKLGQRFLPNDGEECTNDDATFCEHVKDYPAEYIESMINADPVKFKELFGTDEVTLEERFSPEINERPLCASRETIIYPKSGLTQENTWMYIVNFKNYVQGIRVEICTHLKHCLWPGQYPYGFEPICRQKYIYRQLLAINAYGNTVKNSFQMPCCCECVMTSRF